MAHSVVISRADLERMRRTTGGLSPETISKSDRKAELKKKSEERLKNWPNTLEALRKKKESFSKDKEEREEVLRRQADLQVSYH